MTLAAEEVCPSWVLGLLRRAGVLADPEADWGAERLLGGVSSELWRVAVPPGRTVCVKRALPNLLVEARWSAPVERSRFEVRYLQWAASLVPGFVPLVLGSDSGGWGFVMEDLTPFPVWKHHLREGRVDQGFAAELARRLVVVHAATAGDQRCAEAFPTDELFEALRIEPYFRYTAVAHPALAQFLDSLASDLASTQVALVHGDVSPKNVLVGPEGPVLLDAECAWYGDPAFDVAFCASHLLLKCLWVAPAAERLLGALDAFRGAYFDGVIWEPPANVERRAARLLPALLLARVDGRSPVEYLDHLAKDTVRAVASTLLREPVDGLGDVAGAWRQALRGR